MIRFTTLWVLFFVSAGSYAQSLRTSVQSGNWSTKSTWDCNCIPAPTDDVVIESGHRIITLSSITIRNLTINQDGILTDYGRPNTITGHWVVNGTYGGRGDINLTGTNTIWQGAGTVSNLGVIYVTGNKTILPFANLTINSNNVVLQGAFTITNQGTITVGGNIHGTEAASTWINQTNARLNIGGSSGVPLLSTGTLHAFAPGNTVNYYAAYSHTLKLPSTVLGYSTYHHLEISGSGTKTSPNGDVAINGDITINATFSGSGSSKKLFLRGDWINKGNFTEGTGEGTITFDGTTDQFISRAATENLNVMVVNKSSGRVILNTNVIAERGLTMISGNIDTQSYKLTLGQSTAITGTFSWTSGTIIGKLERWIATAALPVLFPIGTALHHSPASIQFTALIPGSLIVEFKPSDPTKNGLPLTENGVTLNNTFRDGYWSITAANGLSSGDFNLDLTGNGFTGFTINDNTRLLTRASSLNPWSLNGTHLVRTGNTIKRTNQSILPGEYGFGDDTNCTAPITSIITGNVDVCKNTGGEVYSVTNQPPNTYAWTISGGTLVAGQGSNSIAVDWGPTGMIGSVAVIEKNTCTEGAESKLDVKIHALPAATITGKINVPELGASESYTVTALPDYSYTWTVTGGLIASGQGTNSVLVNWSNAGAGSVCVTANHVPVLPVVSCGQSVSICSDITIYRVVSSARSGNWQTAANWSCSCVPGPLDNVTIRKTHAISLNNNRTINHVNINQGGSLNTNSNTLTVNGDLAVNGTLTGTGPVVLTGTNSILDGSGAITNTGTLSITSGKTIQVNSTLTKNAGIVSLSANVTVINQGAITLGGSLLGGNANSEWINASKASLSIGGDVLPVGRLYASASENIVRFFGTNAQAIPVPVAGQYEHLFFSDAGIKTAPPGVISVSGNFTNEGVFQHNNGTIAFNGNTEVSGSALTTFSAISLGAGSSLLFPPGLVQVVGNIDFAPGSVFDPSTGTMELTGDSVQNINLQGSSMYNLRINKTSGPVNITSALNMLRLLEIQSSTTLNANGNLIITSRGNTTALDASLGVIPVGARVNGPVTVQRYMQPAGKTNRYIASPVEAATPSAQLSDDFSVNKNSIWIYNEQVDGPSNQGWINPALASPMQTGRGHLAWMYNGSNPITWDVTGVIHQGSIGLPISYTTTSGGVDYDGWNLVGNPYPSAITWSGDPLAWTRSADISPVVYIPDPENNVFKIYNYVDNTGDLTAGIIAMGQAFWVKANQPAPVLTIHERAKTSSTNGKFYRSKQEEPAQLKINLSGADKTVTDAAYLKMNPNASIDFDQLFDAYKLRNEDLNVYFIDTLQRELVMHTRSEIGEQEKVKIGVEVNRPGKYRLSFSGMKTWGDGQWYLVDRFEKQHRQLAEEASYEFEIGDSFEPIHNRFYLTRSQEKIKEPLKDQILLYPNPVNDLLYVKLPQSAASKIMLLDALGNIQWTSQETPHLQINMQHHPSGLYFLHVELAGEVAIMKVVKY